MRNFDQHIFICTNNRNNKQQSCCDYNSIELLAFAKKLGKELGLDQKNIRISSAGCLGNCKEGPVLVIYPKGQWYSYKNEQDIAKILNDVLHEYD